MSADVESTVQAMADELGLDAGERNAFLPKLRDIVGDMADTAAALVSAANAERDALRAEVERLKAERADCAAEHPPEAPYLAWCAAGMPDVSALRARLEKALSMLRAERVWHAAFPLGVGAEPFDYCGRCSNYNEEGAYIHWPCAWVQQADALLESPSLPNKSEESARG